MQWAYSFPKKIRYLKLGDKFYFIGNPRTVFEVVEVSPISNLPKKIKDKDCVVYEAPKDFSIGEYVGTDIEGN